MCSLSMSSICRKRIPDFIILREDHSQDFEFGLLGFAPKDNCVYGCAQVSTEFI